LADIVSEGGGEIQFRETPATSSTRRCRRGTPEEEKKGRQYWKPLPGMPAVQYPEKRRSLLRKVGHVGVVEDRGEKEEGPAERTSSTHAKAEERKKGEGGEKDSFLFSFFYSWVLEGMRGGGGGKKRCPLRF